MSFFSRSLKSIPQSTWSSFKPIAKSIALSFSKDLSNSFSDQDEHCDNGEVKSKKNLKSKAMLRALCCTLARLSGKDGQLDNRSALTAQKGMTAYKLDLQYEALRKGLAYAVLRRYLSSEIVDGIRSLSFIKGKSVILIKIINEKYYFFEFTIKTNGLSYQSVINSIEIIVDFSYICFELLLLQIFIYIKRRVIYKTIYINIINQWYLKL